MKKKGLIMLMGLVTVTQGASSFIIEREEDRRREERWHIVGYLLSGISWTAGVEKDTAWQQLTGRVNPERGAFEEIIPSRDESASGVDALNKEESTAAEERTLKQIKRVSGLEVPEGVACKIGTQEEMEKLYGGRTKKKLNKKGEVRKKETLKARRKKTSGVRIFKQKQCKDCSLILSSSAFFNHQSSHLAQVLCVQAGGTVGVPGLHPYYKEAQGILRR
jgi:hypothetical protein